MNLSRALFKLTTFADKLLTAPSLLLNCLTVYTEAISLNNYGFKVSLKLNVSVSLEWVFIDSILIYLSNSKLQLMISRMLSI